MTEGSRAQPAMNVSSEKGGNSGISTEAGGVIPLLPQPLSIAEGVTLNHPRTRDRSTWTPVQRETYCDGCIVALTAIKVRLERGVLIHTEHPSVAAEVRWLRLATRAVGLIGKQAYASADAGTAFCESPLGRRYHDLELARTIGRRAQGGVVNAAAQVAECQSMKVMAHENGAVIFRPAFVISSPSSPLLVMRRTAVVRRDVCAILFRVSADIHRAVARASPGT